MDYTEQANPSGERIALAFGVSIADAHPRTVVLGSIPEMAATLAATRAPDKSTAGYFCAPMLGDGRRCARNVGPRRFLTFDFDRVDPGTVEPLVAWFEARGSVLAWPTHSSTPAAPRLRVVVFLDRDVDRAEGIRLGDAMAAALRAELGDRVAVDPSTFRGEQPVYLAPTGATMRRGGAAPLPVDSWLAAAPEAAAPAAPREARAIDEYRSMPDEFRAKLIELVAEALALIPADDRNTWVAMGQACASMGEDGRELWLAWSRTSSKHNPDDDGRFDGFGADRTSWRAIFSEAEQHGWDRSKGRPWESLRDNPGVVFGTAPLPMMGGPAPAPVAPPLTRPESFLAAAQGSIPATIENVVDALRSAEAGLRIRFDSFRAELVLTAADGACRAITDDDIAALRYEFGRRGFRPVSLDVMRAALSVVARGSTTDSAIAWIESLRWDGTPRIDGMFVRYFGAADSPYSRAVGAYTMTAAAGRVLAPGVQADMVPVLIGAQGVRKTSAVAALAPLPDTFREINMHMLGRDEAALARNLRGALVCELSELRGLAGREVESVKSFITRRVERWRPLFKEFELNYPRRCIFIGTTNADEFLDDPTGERRWLPLHVGAVDADAIARDRDQLWAEGAVRFRRAGVEWQGAEALAGEARAAAKVNDEWTDLIAAWIDSPPPGQAGGPRGSTPVLMSSVLAEALHLAPRDQTRAAALRAGKAMRALGFEKRQTWRGSRNVKAWHRIEAPSPPIPFASGTG